MRGFFPHERLILECLLTMFQQDSLLFHEMQWKNVVFSFDFFIHEHFKAQCLKRNVWYNSFFCSLLLW